MEARAKIRRFIEANILDFIDEADFEDSDDIFKLGLVNSLFTMKLVNFVKDEFRIELESEDMEIDNFNSVDHIFNLVQKKISFCGIIED